MTSFPQVNTNNALNLAVSEYASNSLNRVIFSSASDIKLLAFDILDKMTNCRSDEVIKNLRSIPSICTMQGKAKDVLANQINLIVNLASNVTDCVKIQEKDCALRALASSMHQSATRWLALDEDGLNQHFVETIQSQNANCFEQLNYDLYIPLDEFAMAKKIRYLGLHKLRNYKYTLAKDTKILRAVFECDAKVINKFPSIFLSNKSIIMDVIDRVQNEKSSKFTSGFCLAKLSSSLRDETEIFYACNIHGRTAGNVRFASDTLKANKVFCACLVKKRGCALQFAAPSLCNDQALVEKAIQNDPGAIVFASEELQLDPYLMFKMVEAHHKTERCIPTETEKSMDTNI